MARTEIELENIENLYKTHRYLDAFQMSASYWDESTDLEGLSVDELIFGCRLASRLGGDRLARWLILKALERDPSRPRVKYYAQHVHQRGQNLFDTLRADAAQPELGSGDPELDSGWLATQAFRWASLRDFERSRRLVERAHALLPNDSWVLACESGILGLEDRWTDALNAAEAAWKLDPGAPYAASALGNSLLNLGRVEEAADRLSRAAENSQSYEIGLLACWYQCAFAETLNEPERPEVLERTRRLAEKLPSLAPLADRVTRSQLAIMSLEIAVLAGNHEQMEKLAIEARSPFHRRVLENLRGNPEGRCIRLPFRRSRQKFQTCLPASLAAALGAMDCPLDPDQMAAEITHGGTSFWAAADWLQERGYIFRFFPVTPEIACDLIRNGIAFILGLEGDDFSHAVAVVGLDEAAGTLLIHDPQSFRLWECLWASLGKNEAPMGPMGMVVVPPVHSQTVDRILPAGDTEAMMSRVQYQKAVALNGPAQARQVVDALESRHPDHPMTIYLRAAQSSEEGHTGAAMAVFQKLLETFPNSVSVRWSLLSACQALGNSALLRETMAQVVESGTLPGVQSQQTWLYPPAAYAASYADLLRTSAATRRKARLLLNSVLNRQPSYADTWRVLADLLWHEGDQEGRLLALRIASCLALNNERYARAYCDSLGSAGRQPEGLGWLESRTSLFRASAGAVGAWMSRIAALEYWGRPDSALAAATAAVESYGESPVLLAFAVPFFARMGRWEQADAALQKLETAGNSALFHGAAADYYSMRGDLEPALRHSDSCVQESPRSIAARSRHLDLTSRRNGEAAAVKLASQWVAEHPGHDEFERLYCGLADVRTTPDWKKDLLLLRRVKRNPEDGWAWRELLFRRLNDYSSGSISRRERLQGRIVELLRQCDRVTPEDSATLRGHAVWREVRSHWFEAVAGWLKVIEAEPENFYSYRRAWECSASFGEEAQRNLFRKIEPMLVGYQGRLSIARDFAFLLALRFGVAFAEEAVLRWKERRPEDPDVIQAASELLLHYGLGVTDAARALAMLEPAVQQFPHHPGLRFALASAQRRTGKHDAAVETLVEITRRHPANTSAQLQLARVLEQAGKAEEARQLMQSAVDRNPLSAEIWDLRVQILARARRFSEARAVIADGLEKLADGIWWRERAVHLLQECGDHEGAVQVARDGVRLFPRGAFLWHLLGVTLKNSPRDAAPGEVEACFRRACELNPGYFDPADQLAILLAGQSLFEEAEHVMLGVMARLSDASTARGRLAWIYRRRGLKKQAVDEMVAVLRGAPWFRWGWAVLMEWLVEDKSWLQARELLSASPDVLRTDADFRRQRLMVLEQAGVPAVELDGEWSNLLRDFPGDIPLHLLRYDSLHGQKRLPECAEVLACVQPLDPNNPWLLARLMEVRAEEGQRVEAINLLLSVWFAEVESSIWPADYCWQAAQRAQFAQSVYARARYQLKNGSRPTPHALSLMAAHAMKQGTAIHGRSLWWSGWLPPRRVREVLALLAFMDKISGGKAGHRSELLSPLLRAGYYRNVIRYWEKNKNLLEIDVDLWGNLGSALVSVGRPRLARRLMANWRTRTGVKMWMIVNYVLACPSLTTNDKRIIMATCQDALNRLPHDHTAKYMAHILAEMQILLGDLEAFRAAFARYRPLFGGNLRQQEYFVKRQRYLLAAIPKAAESLEQGRKGKFRMARLSLQFRRFSLVNLGKA
jgi:tetratricopeptide (TPR) repeat protein